MAHGLVILAHGGDWLVAVQPHLLGMFQASERFCLKSQEGQHWRSHTEDCPLVATQTYIHTRTHTYTHTSSRQIHATTLMILRIPLVWTVQYRNVH